MFLIITKDIFPSNTREVIKTSIEEKIEQLNNSCSANNEELISDLLSLNTAFYNLTRINLLDIAENLNLICDIDAIHCFQKYNEINNRNINKNLNFKNALYHKKIIEETDFFSDVEYLLMGFDEKNKIIMPKIELSKKEITDILNLVFLSLGPDYINLYNKLLLENRIFFLEEDEYKHIGKGILEVNYHLNSSGNYIILGKGNNDLDKIRVLIHELTHILELIKLKENVDANSFNAFKKTFYQEVLPIDREKVFFKAIEQYGIDDNVISSMRYDKLMQLRKTLCFVKSNFKLGDSLQYVYGGLLSSYFDNISPLQKKEVLLLFDKEKTTDYDIGIFDILGCSKNRLNESIGEDIAKCYRR